MESVTFAFERAQLSLENISSSDVRRASIQNILTDGTNSRRYGLRKTELTGRTFLNE
jgi:hypothetical protein